MTRAIIRTGLFAISKTALLLIGVPFALTRLWFAFPHGPRGSMFDFLASGATLGRIVVIVVGELWCMTAVHLLHDIVLAIKGRGRATRSWSARWASSIAGLILLCTASAAISASSAGASTKRGSPITMIARSATRETSAPRDAIRPATPLDEERAIELSSLGTVTLAGLSRRFNLLRRLAQVQRQPGGRPVRPDPRLAAAAIAIARLGDGALLERIDEANHVLWSLLAHSPPRAIPDVRLVRARTDRIEFVLDAPCDNVPLPFHGMKNNSIWVLHASAAIAVPHHVERGRLIPWLIPVGEDEDASYLVAIGPAKTLGIVGEHDRVDEIASAILIGLRTLPWAEELDVELLETQPPSSSEYCFQLSTSSPEAVRALPAASRASSESRLFATWQREPFVYVDRTASPHIDASALAKISAGAGVVLSGRKGTETIVAASGLAVLEPFGISLHPTRASLAQTEAVDALLLGFSGFEKHRSLWRNLSNFEDAFEFALLRDRPALIDSRSVLDDPTNALIAYLVTHSHGAPCATLEMALGLRTPGAEIGLLPRLANDADSALGIHRQIDRQARGTDHETYRLSGLVLTDWARLRDLLAATKGASSDQSIELLRRALHPVRGVPGSGAPALYPWLYCEGLLSEMVGVVVDTAHQLAMLSLARENFAVARWAIEKGKAVEGSSEILTRDEMALLARLGDRRGVEKVFSTLEEHLGALNGAEPSLQTRQLYESLTGRTASRFFSSIRPPG